MEELSKNIEFEAIKAMFETNKIKKMGQIEKLAPTKLSKLLGINYGRYIKKLHNPELFVIKEILKLAQIIDIDFKIILEAISRELSGRKR